MQLEDINDYLKYRDGGLYWINHPQRPDLIGHRAGHINNGYWRLTFGGVSYYVAQLVWYIHTGEWPTFTIDHRDTDGLNDRFENLRRATKGQNTANSGLRYDNTSGLKGVSYCTATGKWRASIRINGREKNLGRYAEKEVAYQAYLTAANQHFGPEFVRA